MYCGQEDHRNGIVIIINKKSAKVNVEFNSPKCQPDLNLSKTSISILWWFQHYAPTIEIYANFQNIVDIASENKDMFLISNWNAKGVRKVASGIIGAVDLDIQSR